MAVAEGGLQSCRKWEVLVFFKNRGFGWLCWLDSNLASQDSVAQQHHRWQGVHPHTAPQLARDNNPTAPHPGGDGGKMQGREPLMHMLKPPEPFTLPHTCRRRQRPVGLPKPGPAVACACYSVREQEKGGRENPPLAAEKQVLDHKLQCRTTTFY